ncbi:LytR C-terminal domain-containing protein [Herbiconiux sp. L3-i23]|uniref:LytR C-terminal domain-containing protein n=1 Tax=Herbiconiux sp. L3-i23 TaxID=2905871 RepID=UPI002051F2BA|nr:LytR C-terminal domain-containing protein [Herbiconiux sp. L3-i23]BDI23730.1 hypothetical protein L3i23_25060 [Herbiconiux sp. L3-i23]
MPTFAPDRFDEVPEDLHRVGAHRAPKKRGRGWITFAWAALATGLIVAAGVTAMFVINDRVSFENPFAASTPTPEPSATPTIAPTIDPAQTVVVLNGTQTDGLAGQVGDQLVAAGWNVTTRSNADSDVDATTVYYSDPTQEGAAKGIVETLGAGRIQLSDAFVIEGVPRLVVVIGADFGAPAAAEGDTEADTAEE